VLVPSFPRHAQVEGAELGVPCAQVCTTTSGTTRFRRSGCSFGRLGVDRAELYEQAGVSHGDIDFLQTYDDYPVFSFMQLEDLGFCGQRRGAAVRA
jgi:hypothetical protein